LNLANNFFAPSCDNRRPIIAFGTIRKDIFKRAKFKLKHVIWSIADDGGNQSANGVRIKYARVYMIVEEVAHARLQVGEAMLSLFLRFGERFAFPSGPIPS
jgi:hypothetical protein